MLITAVYRPTNGSTTMPLSGTALSTTVEVYNCTAEQK